MATGLSQEDQDAIMKAYSMLDDYPLPHEPSVEYDEENRHLHPGIMLRTALDCAPTNAGKVNVAKIIAESDATGKPFNQRLEELSNQILQNLLVPCSTLTFRF